MDVIGKSDIDIATHAVRSGSQLLIEKGIERLFRSTAVDDYRDVVSSLVLYSDALERIGLEPSTLLANYAQSNPRSAQAILSFIGRPPELRSLASGGFRVVQDPVFRYEYSWR